MGIEMDTEITQQEIDDVVREFLEEHTVIGTDKPVELSDNTAKYVISSRKRLAAFLSNVHESHELSEWRTEVMAPCGTARFYQYRECINCGADQYHSNAGRFNSLDRECTWPSRVY